MLDLRQHRTIEIYHKAFWNLLAQKPLYKLTVTDFGKASGLNRKTFYSYYEDVAALAQECVDELMDCVLGENVKNNTNWDATYLLLKNIIQYREQLQLVLNNCMDVFVHHALKTRMTTIKDQYMPENQIFDPELLTEYSVAITWRCIVWGVKNADKSPDELTAICLHTYRSYFNLMANQYKSVVFAGIHPPAEENI